MLYFYVVTFSTNDVLLQLLHSLLKNKIQHTIIIFPLLSVLNDKIGYYAKFWQFTNLKVYFIDVHPRLTTSWIITSPS